MSQQKHLIFGTGPVGLAIMDALVKRGITPTMVNRSGKLSLNPHNLPIIAADVTDQVKTAEVAAGATHIYNATNPPYEKWDTLFPPLNDSILNAAMRARARLIVMDNLYMYGSTGGAPITETLPYHATGKKGVTRARMARTLLDAHQRGDVNVVLGRAADFYGPGVFGSAVGDRVFLSAVQGKPAQVLFSLDTLHSYSYVPDIGEALVTLGLADDAYGKAWHLPHPQAVTTRAFIQKVYAAANQPMKVQLLGKRTTQFLSVFVPVLREMQEMSFSFMEPYVVDDSPYRQRFNTTATSLDDSIATTVAWFRQHASQ